ncbi:hypothetical protein ACHAXA_006829 [Cyclostephanos tholiformis]|uniref:Uncharacterized protein n=1 Tax=Cyclostephanos tholiformis TaxID=382380 RepID=A0ABD3RCW7_9STRA
MTTVIKQKYDVENEERLIAVEAATHNGPVFFAAQDYTEKEKATILTDLDGTARQGAVLKRDLAEMGLLATTEIVEKDNSHLHESFDTALCSLGAIERAIKSNFDATERIGPVNGYSTSAKDNVNSQPPLVNDYTDVTNGSTNWSEMPGRKDTRGIAKKCKEMEPPKTNAITDFSLKSGKVGCNVPRNKNNGGTKVKSSAFAYASNEFEENCTIDYCNATKSTCSLHDNDSEKSATSSYPKELFGSLRLEEASEARVLVSMSSAEELYSNSGENFTEVEKENSGSSKQHMVSGKSHKDVVEVYADILRMDLHTIEGAAQIAHITNSSDKFTHEENKQPPPKEYDEQLGDNDVPVDSVLIDVCDPIQCSQDIPLIGDDDREDSRPASAATGKSDFDESVFNESMFMPNLSIDVTNSPEPKIALFTRTESMPAMSEDESEGNQDDDDDKAFFPNPDHSTKTKANAGANKSRYEKDRIARARLHLHIADENELVLETKPVAPDRSASPPTRANTSRVIRSPISKTVFTGQSSAADLTREAKDSSVTLMANKDAVSRMKSTLSFSRELNQHHKVSSGISKRCDQLSKLQTNRKKGPLWSPPSTKKPARKRSKITVPVESSSAAECGENIKAFMLHGPTPVSQRSKVVSAPSQKANLSIRGMKGKSSKFAVTATGKENNKDEIIVKAKMKHVVDTASSRSMKKSLVSITQDKRQTETSLGRNSKKVVDMARLDRLARPRIRHSITKMADPSPVNNAKKNATRLEAPPSFLSRPVSSRHAIKSTAQLELEEMKRVKPFKARRILGCSTEVKSRFKTATPRLFAPTLAAASSLSGDLKSMLKPSAGARPLPSLSRTSGLYKPTPLREQVSTFAESVQHYLNHGLRGSTPSSKIELTLKSKPPSFLHRQSLSHSTRARSSEEIELDECKKQFRARTIGYGSNLQVKHHSSALERKAPLQEWSRMSTPPPPFRLGMRAGCARPRPSSTDGLDLAKKTNYSTRLFKASISTAHMHYEVPRLGKDISNAGEEDFMF